MYRFLTFCLSSYLYIYLSFLDFGSDWMKELATFQYIMSRLTIYVLEDDIDIDIDIYIWRKDRERFT